MLKLKFALLFILFFVVKSHAQIQPNYMNLVLTHTLYSYVIGSYIDEGNRETVFRPEFLAQKHYYLIFLRTWWEMIDSGKYSSTAAIFQSIKKRPSFLGKHYSLWANIHNLESRVQTSLPRATLLAFYESEQIPDLKERLRKVLDITNVGIFTTAHDWKTGLTIASAFNNSDDPYTNGLSKNMLASIPLQKTAANLATVRDGYIGYLLARPVLSGIRGFETLAGRINRLRNTTLNGVYGATSKMGQALAESLSSTISRHPIPFFLGASAAAHGAALWALGKPRPTLSPVPFEGKNSPGLVVAILWEGLKTTFSPALFEDVRDFRPTFRLESKESLILRVQKFLEVPSGNIQIAAAYLQGEKLLGFDRVPFENTLAMDYAWHRYQQVRKKVFQTAGTDTLTLDKVEKIRKKLIETILATYSRDMANLTSLLLGFGGNCQAETILFTSLFFELKNHWPPGTKAGVILFADHIEPVFYDDQWIYMLMNSSKIEIGEFGVYRPEYLLLRLLTKFKSDQGLSVEPYIAVRANPRLEKDEELVLHSLRY